MKRVRVLEEVFEADEGRLERPGTDWGVQEKGPDAEKDSVGMGEDLGKNRVQDGRQEEWKNCEEEGSASGELPVEPKCFQIILRIDRREAYRIYDRFEEEEILVLPSGDFEIRMNCFLDDWIYGLILSFGPSARVLEPAYVREEIARRIRRMAEMYS